MKALGLLPFLLLTACAVAPHDESAGESADEGAVERACGFIPGCLELFEASDGPFVASVMAYEDADGDARERLSVTYRESAGSSFLLCSQFPQQPPLTLVFVVGPEGARTSHMQPMRVDCPSAWGDNGGQPNTASVSITEDEQPARWDTLFPSGPDGARWYAVEVAATNAHGSWDSDHGSNYQLVMQ